MPCKFVIIRFFEIVDFHAIFGTDFIQEHFPYTPFCLRCQIPISQGDVDSRLEGIVESFNAVGGEEQNPLEIFQKPKEDTYKSIPMNVLDRPFLQEDVCFVKKENGTPRMSNVEDFVQLRFQFSWVGSQFAGADHVKGTLEKFGNAFRSQRFSRPRRTMQHCYKPTSLACSRLVLIT